MTRDFFTDRLAQLLMQSFIKPNSSNHSSNASAQLLIRINAIANHSDVLHEYIVS